MKHIMAAISKSFTVVSGIAFVPIIFKDIDISIIFTTNFKQFVIITPKGSGKYPCV